MTFWSCIMDELPEKTEIAKSAPGLYVSSKSEEGNCDHPPPQSHVHFWLPSPAPSPVHSAQMPSLRWPPAVLTRFWAPSTLWYPQLGRATLHGPRHLGVLSSKGFGGWHPSRPRLLRHLVQTLGHDPSLALSSFPSTCWKAVSTLVPSCSFSCEYLYLSENWLLHCCFRVVFTREKWSGMEACLTAGPQNVPSLFCPPDFFPSSLPPSLPS